MKVTTKIEGNKRSFEVSEQLWSNSRAALMHYADGGEIEEREYTGQKWVHFTSDPSSLSAHFAYRKFERTPKAGEIWSSESIGEHFLVTDELHYIGLVSGGSFGDNITDAVFRAKNIRDYASEYDALVQLIN